MSSAQVSTILRFIRHLTVGWKDNEMPDHQLLERFTAVGDEDAFAALLQRHGAMVLRVCQSVLHNLHDAEDVFQAVFLVLARKAGSIHRREAVSSWLYGVAHRLAMKAQASAARRRNHGKRAATMPSTEPLLDLSLRELHGILHEELQRLPEVYRAPLVLCVLEEKSLEEAARLLGWSKGCVKGRLQRGREQLRARLRHRGINLSVGLLVPALAMNAMSAPVSATLTATTVRAAMQFAADRTLAADVVSAKVAALVQGAMPTMFLSKQKILALVVVAVGASLASLSAFSHHEATSQQESANGAVSVLSVGTQKTAKHIITVRGRVLDPEGKPLANAKLYLGHYGPKDQLVVTERAESNANGRFEFRFPKSQLGKVHADIPIGHIYGMVTLEHLEPRPRAEADPSFTPVGQVMAVAQGFGCDWARINPATDSPEMTLRLVKDVPINGRILDPDGKPVAGAKLYLSSVQSYLGEDLKAALAQFSKSNAFPKGEKCWGGPLPGHVRVVTTGADGRFRMAGLGSERYVSLHIEGPGIASTDFQVITRPGDTVEGRAKIRVYGATFRYLAATSRPIRGMVTDKETGKPLANVMIRIGRSSGVIKTAPEMLAAHTDQEGRFEVLGCPKSPTYDVLALPADTGHYFAALLSGFTDTPGVGPLTVNLKLPRGIPVRGRVIDERTGTPILGTRVHYYPLHPNAASHAFAGFTFAESSAIVGPDGSFAVAALPGPGIVGAVAPDSTDRGRSRTYRPSQVTDKEWDDFKARYKLPEDAKKHKLGKGFFDDEKAETAEIVQINVAPSLVRSLFVLNSFNSLVLLHPSEKDKELKQDLILRPKQGDEKTKDELKKGKRP
jgi:RNA polymerase sigma factor (sigma-70 family)